MKKLIFTITILIATAASMQAQQISENALGLRLGDNDGFGAEISYQRALGDDNRLELDLGWRSRTNVDAFKLTGLYQWVWNIDQGFNWYAGVGGGIGSVSFDGLPGVEDNSKTFIFAAGDVGIEYDFEFPLLISLDFRPEIGFTDGFNDDLDFDIALGLRYQF